MVLIGIPFSFVVGRGALYGMAASLVTPSATGRGGNLQAPRTPSCPAPATGPEPHLASGLYLV
jgi:hypothetical protein